VSHADDQHNIATPSQRFECEASITFTYFVTAATKEEAEALLTEQLGPNWETQCGQPDDIEHPQIEEAEFLSAGIICLGPVEE
jgi:hypothetical protein